MRKLLFVVTLSLGLTACQTLDNISTAVTIATSGVANPVTKNDLYAFENSLIVAFAGLKAYRQACLAEAVDKNCKANIRAMQVYTRQIPPLLTQLRNFVKNNDQVNAAVMFAQVKQLYTNFKNIALANGVAVQ